MGMIYMRYTMRMRNAPSGADSYATFGYMKTGGFGELDSRRIYVGARNEGSPFGWMLRVQSSSSSSSYPGGRCWNRAVPLGPGLVPRAPDSYYYAVGTNAEWGGAADGTGTGETYYYRGVFDQFDSATPAPEPDWQSWFTIEIAWRLHNSFTSQIAGGAGNNGFMWVATSQGTRTAAQPNGSGQTRFYLAGPNVYGDPPLIQQTNRAGLFGWNIYGGAFQTGYDTEIGSMEYYDYWPSDASSHPTGAI